MSRIRLFYFSRTLHIYLLNVCNPFLLLYLSFFMQILICIYGIINLKLKFRCCHDRELDELEREDFTRLKMVKKKKEEQIKQNEIDKEEEKEKLLLQQANGGLKNVSVDSKPQLISLLSDYDATDDADIVFK